MKYQNTNNSLKIVSVYDDDSKVGLGYVDLSFFITVLTAEGEIKFNSVLLAF